MVRTAADNNPAVEGEGLPGPVNGDDAFLTDVCKLGSVTIGGKAKEFPKARFGEPYAAEAGFRFSGVGSAPSKKVVDPDIDMRRVEDGGLGCDE